MLRMKNPPQLRMIISSWIFTEYPTAKNEWSDKQKIRAIKMAGYNGIVVKAKTPIASMAATMGLRCTGAIDIASIAEIEPGLKAFHDEGITQINIQLCDHDTPVRNALPIARKIMEEG